MHQQKNTYLVSGHNYQDARLRLYLPGNGGLLMAVAMMCAGWDGSIHLIRVSAGWQLECEMGRLEAFALIIIRCIIKNKENVRKSLL